MFSFVLPPTPIHEVSFNTDDLQFLLMATVYAEIPDCPVSR